MSIKGKYLLDSKRDLKSVKTVSDFTGNSKIKNNAPDMAAHPENRMQQLIDQSLVGLMYVAMLAVCVLLFRIYQYGVTAILNAQLVGCTVLSIGLFFRRKIPQSTVMGGVLVIVVSTAVLALVRFGLVSPALVIITIFPIIIASVHGKKPALFFIVSMCLAIISVGALYVAGIIQPRTNLQEYMVQPLNWVIYAVLYGGMVFWGAIVAAKLTEYWRQGLRDLKNAEDETLHEREVVATLQRQQSIVQLSGGVAHDFNNVLAAITTNLEIALDNSGDRGKASIVDVALNDAMDAAEKGADLTQSLLSFAKVAVLEPKPLDLNKVVERSVSWIGRTIPENIEIEIELGDDLRAVHADKGSLLSALLNLIINARDAMPDGGHIQIRTQNFEIFENESNRFFKGLAPGNYVELRVKDSGTGIDLSEQSQIFEPFYSTKGPSGGSGLGLAMVQGFMVQSGGTVYVMSELGAGATFGLLFRANEETGEEINTQLPDMVNSESSGATLLVVEDEKLILNSLETMLSGAGYQVLTASSGDQAWKLLSQDSNVDLVLSDVVMPGKLQGADLARNIQRANLYVPVILMSGYTFSSGEEKKMEVVSQLLHKPIRKNELIDAIEKALGMSQLKMEYHSAIEEAAV